MGTAPQHIVPNQGSSTGSRPTVAVQRFKSCPVSYCRLDSADQFLPSQLHTYSLASTNDSRCRRRQELSLAVNYLCTVDIKSLQRHDVVLRSRSTVLPPNARPLYKNSLTLSRPLYNIVYLGTRDSLRTAGSPDL